VPADIVNNAQKAGLMIPAFNVPYLPMIKPVIRAVVDQDCFALIEVARLEWIKFEAQSPAAVMEEFVKWNEPDYVRIHLDHVPVIDEDNLEVDYLSIIREAIKLGYHSVMVDGSRLDLEGNIEATRQVVEMAHQAGIPCKAELGAVLGHEAGPLPPYEDLFESGLGFTDIQEAERFVRETGCDPGCSL
jgi:fructose/tagatose bisphosphate aldolase